MGYAGCLIQETRFIQGLEFKSYIYRRTDSFGVWSLNILGPAKTTTRGNDDVDFDDFSGF